MRAKKDDGQDLGAASAVSGPTLVPIFPLPDLVLFPHTAVPLHVFEPRYRAMVRDATAGSGLIGAALLRPGYESHYEGSPEIHALGTIGRIEDLHRLADGRYLLKLVGLVRVTYHEIPFAKGYRMARATPHPELPVDESDPELVRQKLDLLTTRAMLTRALSENDTPALAIDERPPLVEAVNGACAELPLTAGLRQELLAVDDLRERLRRASRLLEEILRQVLLARSGTDPDGPRV
jgi:Lon protease-like protein